MAKRSTPGGRAKRPAAGPIKLVAPKGGPGLFRTFAELAGKPSEQAFEAAYTAALNALSYDAARDRPAELAWTLVRRVTLLTIARLAWAIHDHRAEGGPVPDDRRLDAELDALEIALDQEFFARPGWCLYVREVCRRLRNWLAKAAIPSSKADALCQWVPHQFARCLSGEWQANQAILGTLLPAPRRTVFTPTTPSGLKWAAAAAALHEQADRRVFEEDFGVRAVYVPLRAYADRDDGEAVVRTVGPVTAMLDDWVTAGRADDDVRVIEGDPGGGKSTLARVFAADWFGRSTGRRWWRAVYAPLHHTAFQAERPLADSIAQCYAEAGLELLDLLDRDSLDPTLLVLDGLDELSRGGHVGLDVVRAFMDDVVRLKDAWNEGRTDARLLVLVCGRPVAADVARKVVRRPDAVLNLIPFVTDSNALSKPEGDKLVRLTGNVELLVTDQRAEWWEKYEVARGRTPSPEAYQAIRKNKALTPVTTHPLLNYLVAFLRETSPDNALPDNLCSIYALLLRRVYDRGWERSQVPAVGRLTFDDFCGLLEELAVAAWHAGNTRGVRVAAVLDRLSDRQRKQLLEVEKKVEDGVLRLLLSFFLRPRGADRRGDEVYEFTHKSFAEYLIARRIAGELDRMAEDRQAGGRRWDDQRELIEWARLFGPTRLDYQLLDYLLHEGERPNRQRLTAWLDVAAKLLETVVRDGMPMHMMVAMIRPSPTFSEMDRWALNSEWAMLLILKHESKDTDTKIEVSNPFSFIHEWIMGRWIRLLDPGWQWSFLDLRHADLRHQPLHRAILSSTDLRYAKLDGAHLSDSELTLAQLIGASMTRANLSRASLAGADLTGANLAGAHLYGADLFEARLNGADLTGARLTKANLTDADLTGAVLAGADLTGADFTGADGVTPIQLLSTIGDPFRLPDDAYPPANWRVKLATQCHQPLEAPKAAKPPTPRSLKPRSK